MTILPVLDFVHAAAFLAWLAGAAALALILIAAPRATAEAESLRRTLRPAALAAVATALLAAPSPEAWALLSAAVMLGWLAARPLLPAAAGGAGARRHLRLDLGAQAALLALLLLRPDWSGAAVLAGVAACLALALALLRSLGESLVLPS